MSDTIFEIEHRPGGELVLRFKAPQLQGLPESTKQHLRSAGKEILLALRNVLDTALEKAEESAGKREKRKTKIEVR